MTAHCSSNACAQGRRPCATPQACHVPEPRQYRPDFGIDGPHHRDIQVPWWAAALGALGAIVALGVLAGYVSGKGWL
jgi:hypothetical protein